MNSLLTVIIPCFNSDPVAFRNTLTSLKNSIGAEFDLYIINDGSDDLGFLDEINNVFDSYTLIQHESNKGLSKARNTGATKATSKYVFFIDSDDQVEPTFLSTALDILETNPQWTFCNSWFKGIGHVEFKHQCGLEMGANFLLENHTISSVMVRRDIHLLVGGYDEKIIKGNEDWDYWLKMASSGFWGYSIPKMLLNYYSHHEPTYWENRDSPYRFTNFFWMLTWKHLSLWVFGFWHKIIANWKKYGFNKLEISSFMYPNEIRHKRNSYNGIWRIKFSTVVKKFIYRGYVSIIRKK